MEFIIGFLFAHFPLALLILFLNRGDKWVAEIRQLVQMISSEAREWDKYLSEKKK